VQAHSKSPNTPKKDIQEEMDMIEMRKKQEDRKKVHEFEAKIGSQMKEMKKELAKMSKGGSKQQKGGGVADQNRLGQLENRVDELLKFRDATLKDSGTKGGAHNFHTHITQETNVNQVVKPDGEADGWMKEGSASENGASAAKKGGGFGGGKNTVSASDKKNAERSDRSFIHAQIEQKFNKWKKDEIPIIRRSILEEMKDPTSKTNQDAKKELNTRLSKIVNKIKTEKMLCIAKAKEMDDNLKKEILEAIQESAKGDQGMRRLNGHLKQMEAKLQDRMEANENLDKKMQDQMREHGTKLRDLKTKIELSTSLGKIVITEDDDPAKVARKFGNAQKLKEEEVERLTAMLTKAIHVVSRFQMTNEQIDPSLYIL
jgi:hypothetical protein